MGEGEATLWRGGEHHLGAIAGGGVVGGVSPPTGEDPQEVGSVLLEILCSVEPPNCDGRRFVGDADLGEEVVIIEVGVGNRERHGRDSFSLAGYWPQHITFFEGFNW